MKRASDGRRWLLALLAGDLLVLTIFAGVGMVSHQTFAGPGSVLPTAAPFAIAWTAVGFLLGAFRPPAVSSPGAAARSLLWPWLLTIPVSLVLRALLLGRDAPLAFGIVAFFLGGAFLLAWRVGFSLAYNALARTRRA